MIHNLKAKLASIQKETVKEESPKEKPLDTVCSHYSYRYKRSDVVGNWTLDVFFDMDMATLKKVCRVECEEDFTLEDIIFFDTETTGLSGGVGTVAFLIGIGRVIGDEIIVEQFLMNDYHQECDMLQRLFDILSQSKAVASYNGKSFDAPIVSSRSIINRIRQPLDRMPHFDLLYPTRRLYKRRLENCRLGTIEEVIMGYAREDDIPGGEIPEIFLRYVKYGESDMLQKVLEHNQQDILSLSVLSGLLAKAYHKPLVQEHTMDILSQGVILEQDGDNDRALQCYEATAGRIREAKWRRATLLKRMKRWEEACEAFMSISEETTMGCMAEVEMAKIYEHHLKDMEKARIVTDRAIDKIKHVPSSFGLEIMSQLMKRRQRIVKKLNKEGNLSCHC